MSPEALGRGAGGKGGLGPGNGKIGSAASFKSMSASSLESASARRSPNPSSKRGLSSSPVFKPVQEIVDDDSAEAIRPQEHQRW